MQRTDSTPWYKQFWPWFILAILGWGVVSATTTLVFAVLNPPQMMTGDYARLGKALVDTHVRFDRAEALGLAGRLALSGDELRLDLQSVEADALADTVLLLAQHPTDASRDRQLMLIRTADGRYAGRVESLPPRGRMIVSDLEQSWWISSAYELEDGVVDIQLVPEHL
ncbi:hypothetical protein HFP89_09410 [Wenzhouxiangella sp. XN79A]|uniref:FixH family protein n=1 Tax=Wenzhouxiangella sp. XN79A TaxID=2724193 RepID=UPI00144A8A02|nr:FixH family protein [Wenzhouxiangella sp. XN79A]NKI35384.1 hypothetical protein [Wenzhouxiangella sp. XN79A]